MARRFRTVVLAVVLGAAVGLLAAVYLLAVHLLQGLLWEHGQPRLPVDARLGTVLLCAGGGVLVGLLRIRHDRDTPHDLNDGLVRLDEVIGGNDAEPRPAPSVPWMLRAALLGVVSLGFGASLGPEAPLLVLAMGFGSRIARILRMTDREAAYISAAAALSGLFGGPLGAVVLPVEGSTKPQRATPMLGYGVIAGVSGLIALLLALPGEGGHRFVIPDSGVSSGRDLVTALGWAAIGAVPATLVGLAILVVAPWSRAKAEAWIPAVLPRAVVGGLVLGGCGVLAPLALFSGQLQGQPLLDSVGERTAWGLLGLTVVNLVATLACLSTGWFGGQIFPAVFGGMAISLVVVALFPSAPVGAVAAAGAGAATTAALRRPLAAVLLLLLFFPGSALLGLALGAAVASLAISALGERAPSPEPLGFGH